MRSTRQLVQLIAVAATTLYGGHKTTHGATKLSGILLSNSDKRDLSDLDSVYTLETYFIAYLYFVELQFAVLYHLCDRLQLQSRTGMPTVSVSLAYSRNWVELHKMVLNLRISDGLI